MYLFYFVIYATIFDTLYGLATMLLLAIPFLGMAVASTFFEYSTDYGLIRATIMLSVPLWKGATLWSALRATKLRVRDGETFTGAIRATLGEARFYLSLMPVVAWLFRQKTLGRSG